MSEVREEGGPGFHSDIAAVLVRPRHQMPPEVSLTDDVAVTVILRRPPLPSSCDGSIDGRVATTGCVAPWATFAPHSLPRWICFTDVTHDGHVDPPLLPRPTVSVATDEDPSPEARVPPSIPRVVTD
jgi:hypothetical protein